jgi:hypothetical protein
MYRTFDFYPDIRPPQRTWDGRCRIARRARGTRSAETGSGIIVGAIGDEGGSVTGCSPRLLRSAQTPFPAGTADTAQTRAGSGTSVWSGQQRRAGRESRRAGQ